MNRPRNYFTNLSPERAIEMVREEYSGKTPDELRRKDGSLSKYIGETEIGGKTLLKILLKEGILVPGSKSHPKRKGERYPKWETLTVGYRSFREYAPHYVGRARH